MASRHRGHHRSGHPRRRHAQNSAGHLDHPCAGLDTRKPGPNWVALNNADTSAQMRVTIKPAGGTDVLTALQSDINQFTSTASAILGNGRT
jgi:hypothetical protein